MYVLAYITLHWNGVVITSPLVCIPYRTKLRTLNNILFQLKTDNVHLLSVCFTYITWNGNTWKDHSVSTFMCVGYEQWPSTEIAPPIFFVVTQWRNSLLFASTPPSKSTGLKLLTNIILNINSVFLLKKNLTNFSLAGRNVWVHKCPYTRDSGG